MKFFNDEAFLRPDVDEEVGITNLDIRPSLNLKLKLALQDKENPWKTMKLSDFLTLTEAKAKRLSGFNKDEFASLLKALGKYNLRFEMTEADFNEYRDALYLKSLAKEEEEKAEAEKQVETEKAVEERQDPGARYYGEWERDDFVKQRIKEANLHGELEQRPLPMWNREEAVDEANRLRDQTCTRHFDSCDMEWIRVRIMEAAFEHLPWYYRLLPVPCQVQKAKEYANALFDDYMEGLKERIVAYSRYMFEQEKAKVVAENNEKAQAKKIVEANANKDFSIMLKAQDKKLEYHCVTDDFLKALTPTSLRKPIIDCKNLLQDEI